MYALPISNCNIVNPFIRLPATVSVLHLHVYRSSNDEPGSFQVLFVPTLQDVMDRACMQRVFVPNGKNLSASKGAVSECFGGWWLKV